MFKKKSKYIIPGGFERIYFVHIRKTGGTSLNYSFLSIDGGDGENNYKILSQNPKHQINIDGKLFIGWNKKKINKGQFFYAFSHKPFYSIEHDPKTFFITILRDPAERVLSHYNMLLEYKRNSIDHPCMKVEGEWLGNSFSDFLQRIPKEHLLNQLYTFSENFNLEEAINNISRCNQVIVNDYYKDGLKDLSEKIGLNLPYYNVRKTDYYFWPNEEEMKNLKTLLETEIKFYDEIASNYKLKYENTQKIK